MDHAYRLNVSLNPPTYPGSFALGYPQAASADGTVPPTYPGAWWYYMVTEEIRNVLIAAGITPDPSKVNQLTSAVQVLITEAVGGSGSLSPPKVVPTYAALQALPSATTTTVIVLGGGGPMDGGEGTFWVNTADVTNVTDGGMMFKMNDNGGVAHRLFQGSVNPCWFGYVLDANSGSNGGQPQYASRSGAGANNITALNNALVAAWKNLNTPQNVDALHGNGGYGGSVEIPDGYAEWAGSVPVIMNPGNKLFSNAGQYGAVVCCQANFAPSIAGPQGSPNQIVGPLHFVVNGSPYSAVPGFTTEVKGLTFLGLNNGCPAITVDSNTAEINGCWFGGWNNGIVLNNINTVVDRCVIEQCVTDITIAPFAAGNLISNVTVNASFTGFTVNNAPWYSCTGGTSGATPTVVVAAGQSLTNNASAFVGYRVKIMSGPGAGQTGIVAASGGANFTGTIAGTVLTAASVNGSILVGQSLVGAGVAAGTTISSLGTGSGGAGTYNLSTASTISTGEIMSTSAAGGANATNCTIASNVLTVGVGAVIRGTLAVGQGVVGVGVPTGVTITSLGTGTGGVGTYNLSASAAAVGTAESMNFPSSAAGYGNTFNVTPTGGTWATAPTSGSTVRIYNTVQKNKISNITSETIKSLGVNLVQALGLTVENVDITQDTSVTSITIGPVYIQQSEDIHFTEFSANGGLDFRVANNAIQGVTFSGASRNITFNGGAINGWANAFYIGPSAGNYVDSLSITGMNLNDNENSSAAFYDGIKIVMTGNFCSNNGSATNPGTGIIATNAEAGASITLNGNIIDGLNPYGVAGYQTVGIATNAATATSLIKLNNNTITNTTTPVTFSGQGQAISISQTERDALNAVGLASSVAAISMTVPVQALDGVWLVTYAAANINTIATAGCAGRRVIMSLPSTNTGSVVINDKSAASGNIWTAGGSGLTLIPGSAVQLACDGARWVVTGSMIY